MSINIFLNIIKLFKNRMISNEVEKTIKAAENYKKKVLKKHSKS